MTKIKLCGLTKTSDIEKANELKPEYIGFVFWEKSRRNVTKEQAAELKSVLDPGILAVGVFVDEDPECIADLVQSGIIDVAQLHGSESPEYIGKLKEMTGAPVIKAYQFGSDDNTNKKIADEVNESPADFVLLDAGKGCGSTFDWSITDNINKPFFLAGGLNCDNVDEALRKIKPYAVDVSSGIETDKVKDPAKMERFVGIVRNRL